MTWLLAWCLATAGAADLGWRHDGTGIFPSVTPPAQLAPADKVWRTPLPSWGNASPVVIGRSVCTVAEPTTVLCLDAATGKERWRATNDRLDTLPAAERPAMQAKLAEVPALAERLSAGLSEMSRLRREARRGDESATARLATLSAELDAVKVEHDELAAWLAAEDLGMIGYASATPATNGTDLFVLTGNGVVSRFTADGRRVWSVWLGPPITPMRGFDFGSVASPQLHGDRLVVAHGHLTVLDAATGTVKWKDRPTWRHYGTPALTRIGTLDVVLTPDGRALDLRDGKVLLEDLADVYYVGPIVHGDRVWWIGGRGHKGDPNTNRATGVRLRAEGSGLASTPLFDVALPEAERVYATPLFHDDRLYVLALSNVLWVLDANTGSERGRVDLAPRIKEAGSTSSVGYGQPVLAGGRIHLGWEAGYLASVSAGDAPALTWFGDLGERGRSTPWFTGGQVYVRTLDALWRFGR